MSNISDSQLQELAQCQWLADNHCAIPTYYIEGYLKGFKAAKQMGESAIASSLETIRNNTPKSKNQ